MIGTGMPALGHGGPQPPTATSTSPTRPPTRCRLSYSALLHSHHGKRLGNRCGKYGDASQPFPGWKTQSAVRRISFCLRTFRFARAQEHKPQTQTHMHWTHQGKSTQARGTTRGNNAAQPAMVWSGGGGGDGGRVKGSPPVGTGREGEVGLACLRLCPAQANWRPSWFTERTADTFWSHK